MKVKTPQSLPSLDDELLLQINDIVAVLPGSTIDDFLVAQSSPSTSPSGQGRIVFDCKLDGEGVLPLNPADRHHPLWQEIDAALADSQSLGAALALPRHLALLIESDPQNPPRLLVIPDSDIVRCLRVRREGERPTHSELRLLKQLICGLGLSEAGKVDGVSHETKRTHYKSLSRKLGVRSQSQLTNRVLTRLLFDSPPRLKAEELSADEYFIELAREFIPSARCFQLLGENGTRHRFVDLGPVAGRPVAFVHPMVLPDFREEDVASLHEHNLRLIVPLRNGAMSKTANRLSAPDHMDHACEGIDLVRTHFAGNQLDLILCVSGCAYGIEYARRHPERVRSMAFVGACVQPRSGTSLSDRLRNGFYALARTNWPVYSDILQFFCRRLGQPDTLRQLLHRYYRPCPADFAIVQQEYTGPGYGERGRKLFAASSESITHDFYHQGQQDWHKLPSRPPPMAFIHGELDAIHRLEDVQALANDLGEVPVHPLPRAGQLLYYDHFEPLLARCSAFFANPTVHRGT